MYKVMIVDDEYPARNMLDLLINWEENGFEMAAKAENGKQALEIYEKLRPELLITDIQSSASWCSAAMNLLTMPSRPSAWGCGTISLRTC